MRQVVLDTETTGLEPEQGHRIIEIGCVELISRRPSGRTYHQYVNPQREVDAGAVEVHGITNEYLSDKPVFGQIADEFLDFIDGAELIIHNAPFDVGFINAEVKRLGGGWGAVAARCRIIDTLVMARQLHPGRRNNLDALCERYGVDNTQRDLHGALLDAEILADVYLAMTSGQTDLALGGHREQDDGGGEVSQSQRQLAADRRPLPVYAPSAAERAAHDALLTLIDKKSGGQCLWRVQST